ncbi:MAG: hypothetical protein OEU62_00405, partial [Gammaproteobacteria bacterium]|nr:hypothetical protein [Gammaproteobacteria bacterium]
GCYPVSAGIFRSAHAGDLDLHHYRRACLWHAGVDSCMPPALASAGFEGNRLVEIIRTAAPAIIVMGGAIQSTEVLKNRRNYSRADVTVKVTGHQR